MHTLVAGLSAEHPLPAGWSPPEIHADEIRIGDLSVGRVGIASRSPSGEEATGSAAERGGTPGPRAWYELLERVATLEAKGRRCVVRDAAGAIVDAVSTGCPFGADDPIRRPSRSNGVAMHTTWSAACEAARLELIERDRVLRAWIGELDVAEIASPGWLEATGAHDWRTVLVEPGGDAESVAITIGFPTAPDVPLARGYAARLDPICAVEASAAEALQSLAFCWGEEIPREEPPLAPTALFHLDYWLRPEVHDHLRRWLDGEHRAHHAGSRRWEGTRRDGMRWADLRPSAGDRWRVARALDTTRLPLWFGLLPPTLGSHLPAHLQIHPIA